jgi:hypothetical protein
MVGQSPDHPKVKDSSPADVSGTEREDVKKLSWFQAFLDLSFLSSVFLWCVSAADHTL